MSTVLYLQQPRVNSRRRGVGYCHVQYVHCSTRTIHIACTGTLFCVCMLNTPIDDAIFLIFFFKFLLLLCCCILQNGTQMVCKDCHGECMGCEFHGSFTTHYGCQDIGCFCLASCGFGSHEFILASNEEVGLLV